MIFGDNVLEDPSFETDHWLDTLFLGSFAVAHSDLARTGDYGMAITRAESSTAATNMTFGTVGVEPGDTWRFSIWYRTEGTTDPDQGLGTRLRIRDGSNNVLESSATFEPGDGYSRATVSYQVEEGVSSLRPTLIVSHTTGTLIVDDVAFQVYAPSSAILTGLEQRGITGLWTTFEEEADYLDALLAEVPGIREEIIGQGETGLDLRMFKLGTGATHALLVAQVHAPELSGRDSLLSLIRDWAADTGRQGYLEDVTLLVVPTARPDSQTERNNANGVNVNRDHVQVTQSETQALQQVITDYEPALVVDIHEGANIDANYATSKVLNPNIAEGVAGLSDELEQAVKTAVEGGGWTWEPYQGHNITGPEFMHNSGGIRHAVGLLLESKRLGGAEVSDRYWTQYTALNAILDWHTANMQRVTDAAVASRQSVTDLAEVHFPTGTQSTWDTITPAPHGYRINSEDIATLETVRTVFSLPQPDEDNRFPADVPQRVLIHYLMDRQSEQRLVDGVRDYHGAMVRASSPPIRPQLLFKTGGEVHAARFAGAGIISGGPD